MLEQYPCRRLAAPYDNKNPCTDPDADQPAVTLSPRCETLEDLRAVPADVASLFAQAERTDPQFGLGWFQNLVETALPDRARVYLHVLRLDGAAVAVVPLRVTAARGGHVAQALGNFYTCLYAPALARGVNAEDLATLFKDIKRRHAPLASLSLAPLQDDTAALDLLKAALRGARLATFEHPAFGNWFLPVAGSCADYMAKRPGELRNTLKRMGKKFAGAGGRFEIVTGGDLTEAAVAAYTQVYNSSWKRPEPFAEFMPGLARLCAARGWLRLGLAWIGDRPVAAQLWIVASGKANIYKLAYDNEFRHLSPGSLLTAQLMQRTIDQDKVTEIDYLKGDDAYKNQWMTHRRERMGLLAFNLLTSGGLFGFAREVVGRTLVALKLRHRHETADQTSEPAQAYTRPAG